MLIAFCLRGTGLLFSKASCLTKFMVRTFSTSSSCLFPDSKAPFVLLKEVCLQMFQQTKSLNGIAEGMVLSPPINTRQMVTGQVVNNS